MKTRAVRAIYVTPHHQYPTTVALSPPRRMKLLSLAAEHRVAVIEDDYDHEFHYASTPLAPLASADAAGVVIYLGTPRRSSRRASARASWWPPAR